MVIKIKADFYSFKFAYNRHIYPLIEYNIEMALSQTLLPNKRGNRHSRRQVDSEQMENWCS